MYRYKRKYIVGGRQAYLTYVLFTFPFYYYDYRNKKTGKTHSLTHTPVSYTHLPFTVNIVLRNEHCILQDESGKVSKKNM